ncbi:hypothetical protein FNW02_13035 [Komarekiella sp. 'clone 1']|uniref:Uncharacterized protein n=1 Tax=Komarekiella delphini-convector SJRDD-AB1 TaxID=2593771 RepID=A0AA40SWT9_9NOST|nr:hypothetical protein [Komarekiella delphini-convector]MBD6616729.1 hypothetical protein [Komarekiella delphini-convector SJRDD-AB1]
MFVLSRNRFYYNTFPGGVLPSKPNTSGATSAFEHIKNKFLKKIEAPTQEVSQPFISFEDKDVNDELQRLKEEQLLPSKPQDQVTVKKDIKLILVEAIRETQKAMKTAVLNQEASIKIMKKLNNKLNTATKGSHSFEK